jgi:Cysteine dioxygenase type I
MPRPAVTAAERTERSRTHPLPQRPAEPAAPCGPAGAVVLLEWRAAGPELARQVLARPVRAGGARSFGPRYAHDVRNEATAAVAVSVHAYSPPMPAMTRYELTPAGLVRRDTEAAVAW